MSAYAMFSVAVIVAIFYTGNVNGMKDSDIENVLGQLHKEVFSLQRVPLDQSLESEENTDDVQLIENIARSPQVQIGFPYKNKDLLYEKDRRNKNNRYSYWPWRQILYVTPAWLKSVYTLRKQNDPLDDMKDEDGNKDVGDYSKVYLVLDPDADIKGSDVRDLSNKVASFLTKSNESKMLSLKDLALKKRRYKGFVVRDYYRRRMRESKEMYNDKDSLERDYKPKRARVDFNGGGGRTAIPYIRHRGDIFEKE